MRGYLSTELGEPTFKITRIFLCDGTYLGAEGEHDLPYLVMYSTQPQPNYDDATLRRLIDEAKE